MVDKSYLKWYNVLKILISKKRGEKKRGGKIVKIEKRIRTEEVLKEDLIVKYTADDISYLIKKDLEERGYKTLQVKPRVNWEYFKNKTGDVERPVAYFEFFEVSVAEEGKEKKAV